MVELAASSPKRSPREMKRGEDGAAVKISRRPKPNKKFWAPQESHANLVFNQICGYGGIGSIVTEALPAGDEAR